MEYIVELKIKRITSKQQMFVRIIRRSSASNDRRLYNGDVPLDYDELTKDGLTQPGPLLEIYNCTYGEGCGGEAFWADSLELHNIPFYIKVGLEKYNLTGNLRNTVRVYLETETQ